MPTTGKNRLLDWFSCILVGRVDEELIIKDICRIKRQKKNAGKDGSIINASNYYNQCCAMEGGNKGELFNNVWTQ